MKVLHLVSHLNAGGITRYLLTLAERQKEAGYQVYVWGSRGEFLPDVRMVSVEVFDSVPRTKSELSPRLWLQLPGLIATLREHSIDIMHAHTRVTQVLACLVSRLTGVPFVTTAHGFYKRRSGRRLFPCWGKTIFAISRSVRDGLIDTFGIDRLPRIDVVANAMDLEAFETKRLSQNRFALRAEYEYKPKDLLLVSLSRVTPSKGIHCLISAFAEARKEVPNLKLLVAGGGDSLYLEELKRQCVKLELGSSVRFPGNVFEITRVLAIADIFVAPYFSPEGFGLSVLEAMAAELPIIASDIGGINELLEGGSLGLLFRERDEASLTRAILQLAKDESLRETFAKKAKQASQNYSSRTLFEAVEKGYLRALKRT